jgi:hypothetical protein
MLKDFQLTSLEDKSVGFPRCFVINTQHIVSFELVDDTDDAIITLVTGERFYCPFYENYIAYNRNKDNGAWEYVDKEF